MSDTISFEKVKVFFLEEADKAKNRNDLLERVIQRAYQQGKKDAVKDGDAKMYPNGNPHIMQLCPDDGAKIVTNADRIRAMTDEALASFLCTISNCCVGNCLGEKHCSFDNGNGYLVWLKKEVKDG